MELVTSNSRQYDIVKHIWIPGGTLGVTFRKQTKLVNEKIKDSKERWCILSLKANKKHLLIISAYRLPDSLGDGIYTVKAQLDKAGN